MMQAASDIFLGWTKGVDANRYFYWRQLRDMKGSAVVEAMSPGGLEFYARLCGWTLARAHARSGRPDRDRRIPRQERRVRPRRSPTSPSATPTRTSATSANLFVLSSQDASRRTKAWEAMSGIATRYPGLGVLDSRALPAHHRSDPAAL